MKVFISWSGERSKTIAEFLRYWIPEVIQAIQPWMSAEDIDPGARWSTEIVKELEASRFGVICLTPENINSPWVLFEAGALAKTLETTHVCPYLINLDFSDLKSPLAQFQATKADRDGTLSLLRSINQCADIPVLSEDRLKRAFERCWPDLESVINDLPSPEAIVDDRVIGRYKGLESVFLTRGAALNAFAEYFKTELDKADRGEPSRIWIVSSSFKGFIMSSSDTFNPHKLIEMIANCNCDFRLLMTDPQMADLRARQERRLEGDIQLEIRASIALLEGLGVRREMVRYYPGTPTVFAIATTDKMLLNPYPYECESQRSFSVLINKTQDPEGIYQQYIKYHFEKPWAHAKEISLREWNKELAENRTT